MLAFILISIAILFLLLNKKEKTIAEKEEDKAYRCVLEASKEENYTTNYIIDLEVEQGRLMKSNSYAEMNFKSEESYQEFKNNESLMEGRTPHDKEKKLTFISGGEHDYTKTPDGEELNYSYQDFKETMEKQGYVCEKVSE